MSAPDYVPKLAVAPVAIEGHTIGPGKAARIALDFCELADGARIKIPAIVANGTRPGPRLYIGATIHGDEVVGAAIVAKLMAEIDPEALAGSIVAIPVQHPLAFQADHRFPISQFMKSPLDHRRLTPGRAFPAMRPQPLAAARREDLRPHQGFELRARHPHPHARRTLRADLDPAQHALGADAGRALWLAEQLSSGFIVKGEKACT